MTEIKRSGQQSGQTLVSCLSGTSTPAPCSCMWLGYDLAESLSLAKAIQEPQSFRHCWSTLTFFPEFQKPRRRCYGFLLSHCTPRPEPHNGECSIHSQHASCPGHGCLRPGGFSQANDGLERVGPLSVAVGEGSRGVGNEVRGGINYTEKDLQIPPAQWLGLGSRI